jgi:hypothetical protein
MAKACATIAFMLVQLAAAAVPTRRSLQADNCADIDGDGTVAVGDLLGLLANFGVDGYSGPADTDSNGAVDVTDLLNLLAQFGSSCSRSVNQAVDCGGAMCSGSLKVSVDNSYTAYINGQDVGSNGNWVAVDTYTFIQPVSAGELVIGIDAKDAEIAVGTGVGALIAEVTVGDQKVGISLDSTTQAGQTQHFIQAPMEILDGDLAPRQRAMVVETSGGLFLATHSQAFPIKRAGFGVLITTLTMTFSVVRPSS